MRIDRVTITGADDSVSPADLVKISADFPWVEWGILLSRSQEGGFPSLEWMRKLARVDGGGKIKLSGHLCGWWVRALCLGEPQFLEERPDVAYLFQRVQLNFHARSHPTHPRLLAEVMKAWGRDEYILQFDEVNDQIMSAVARYGVNCAPLFDTSGGAGIEPEQWPSAERFLYSGYAGGLHPDRLGEQLDKISKAAGDSRIWIDVETHVRSSDDTKLDLVKVVHFLEAAAPWVS